MPRRSLKRNITFDHEIGDSSASCHSFPAHSSKRALERVTVPSPGAVPEYAISFVFQLKVMLE